MGWGRIWTHTVATFKKPFRGEQYVPAPQPLLQIPATPTVDILAILEIREERVARLALEEASIKAMYDAEITTIIARHDATVAFLTREGSDLDNLITSATITASQHYEQFVSASTRIISYIDSEYPDIIKQDFIHQTIKQILQITPETDPEMFSIAGFDKHNVLLAFLTNPVLKGQLDSTTYDDETNKSLAEDLFSLNHLTVAQAVLQTFRDVNTIDKTGHTTFHRAIKSGNHEIIMATIHIGGNPMIDFPDGKTCLYKTAFHATLPTMHAIMATGAPFDPDTLEAACLSGKADVFDWSYSRVGNCNYVFKSTNTILISAMSNCFAYAIDKLLALGANINLHNNRGETALLFSAKVNCADYTKDLVTLGANPLVIDSENENALHHFVKSIAVPIRVAKNISFYDKTVLFGIEVIKQCNIQAPSGPVLYGVLGGKYSFSRDGNITLGAINNSCQISELKSNTANFDYALDILKFLTSKGLDINSQNSKGQTPFMLACKMKLFYFAKQLVNNFDIDFSIMDESRSYSIHHAIYLQDPGLIELIVQKGSNINAQDALGRTALHWATIYNSLECVQKTLELGADPLMPQNGGYKPLHLAVYNGFLPIIEALLPSSGINLETSSDGEKLTPFLVACDAGQNDAINYFLDLGVNVNSVSSLERPGLSFAISANKNDSARLLIAKRADINKGMFDGDTPLHMAAYVANLEGFQILIEAGASINAQNHDQITPLHLLIQYNRSTTTLEQKKSCVEYLLSNGADPNILDKDGKNCFNLTQELYPEIHEMLLPYLIVTLSAMDIVETPPIIEELVNAEDHIIELIGADPVLA